MWLHHSTLFLHPGAQPGVPPTEGFLPALEAQCYHHDGLMGIGVEKSYNIEWVCLTIAYPDGWSIIFIYIYLSRYSLFRWWTSRVYYYLSRFNKYPDEDSMFGIGNNADTESLSRCPHSWYVLEAFQFKRPGITTHFHSLRWNGKNIYPDDWSTLAIKLSHGSFISV